MPKTQGAWIGLAAGVCLVVAVLGWFFFVAPRVDEEASIRDQEAALAGENDALQQKVASLKEEFAQIATYEAELAATQVKIPTTPEVEAMFDELDSLATAQGVLVTSITAEAATPLAGGEVAAAVVDAPADPAAASEAVPAPAPAPASPDALVLFPMKLVFTANHDQTRAFFQALQGASSRYFLVSNPLITAAEEGTALPALPGADAPSGTALQVSVTVYAFVFTDGAAAEETAPEEGIVPVAPSGRDPFAVVAGQ